MKRTKLTLIICILTTALLVLCGCTTYDNFREGFIDSPDTSDNTITIGVYEPLAGADKDGAEAEIRGIELAHKLYPNAGGRQVRLVYADNNSDLDAADTAINTLVSKSPSVILGSYGALYSLLAGEYIQEACIPAIAITNTNPLITRHNSYYFRVCYIDATQGRLLASYLDHLDEEKAGVMLPEGNDAAMAMATSFTDAVKDNNDGDDAIAFYERYTTGELDFSEHLKSLQKSKVKYVILPGEMADSINIINQAADMGLDVTFLGDVTWESKEFRSGLQPNVDPSHIAFVQFFAADGKDKKDTVSEERGTFLQAYYEAYGSEQEPDEATALGYDAYLIAVDAIMQATGNSQAVADGEAIRNVLLRDDYQFEGASGTIRFNKTGDPKKTAYISTWEGDSIKAVYTIETSDQ